MISYQRVVITKKICVIIPIYMLTKGGYMVNYPNKKKSNHYTSMIEGKHNTAHRGMNL